MTSYAKDKLPRMTNYSTQTIEKWVLDVECLCYVYEIKHKKLCDHTIVPLNQWLLLDPTNFQP
jgi:hypothetical protein